jgi:hypothetical protein
MASSKAFVVIIVSWSQTWHVLTVPVAWSGSRGAARMMRRVSSSCSRVPIGMSVGGVFPPRRISSIKAASLPKYRDNADARARFPFDDCVDGTE